VIRGTRTVFKKEGAAEDWQVAEKQDPSVTPAQAGVQKSCKGLDSRLRGNDSKDFKDGFFSNRLGCRKRNRGSKHFEIALNGLGAGSVNIQKLNAHAFSAHMSHLGLDQHDPLFQGQPGHQFNLVASLESGGGFGFNENPARAEIAYPLYAFETSDDHIQIKLDPWGQPLLFVRSHAFGVWSVS
jgi:hypothetical protein